MYHISLFIWWWIPWLSLDFSYSTHCGYKCDVSDISLIQWAYIFGYMFFSLIPRSYGISISILQRNLHTFSIVTVLISITPTKKPKVLKTSLFHLYINMRDLQKFMESVHCAKFILFRTLQNFFQGKHLLTPYIHKLFEVSL